jgi:hypothetical protein
MLACVSLCVRPCYSICVCVQGNLPPSHTRVMAWLPGSSLLSCRCNVREIFPSSKLNTCSFSRIFLDFSIFEIWWPRLSEVTWNQNTLSVIHSIGVIISVNINQNTYTQANLNSKSNVVKSHRSNSWRIRWARHEARIKETRNPYKILVGKSERNRPLWKCRSRWEYKSKLKIQEIWSVVVDWIQLDQWL